MKKFKGFVNGTAYDNEKNYRKAVSEAVEAGEVNAHSEYVEVVEPNEPKKSEKPYQLTKEDMDEIREFNKNYADLKNLYTSAFKVPNLETIFKTCL